MATTTKRSPRMRGDDPTIADPSVCARCAGGEHLPGRGEAICILCVLAEEDAAGSSMTANVVRVEFGRDDDDKPTPPAGGAAAPRPAVRVHLARQRVAA